MFSAQWRDMSVGTIEKQPCWNIGHFSVHHIPALVLTNRFKGSEQICSLSANGSPCGNVLCNCSHYSIACLKRKAENSDNSPLKLHFHFEHGFVFDFLKRKFFGNKYFPPFLKPIIPKRHFAPYSDAIALHEISCYNRDCKPLREEEFHDTRSRCINTK